MNEQIETEKKEPSSLSDTKAEKKKTRRILGSAAAGLTALSVMIGSIFSGPAEIIKPPANDAERPAVIVQYEAQTENDEVLEDEEEAEEKKKGLRAVIKRFILGMPLLVRVLFILPLWVIGYGLIAAFTALFEPVIAPVLGVIIKWLLIAGVFAGAFFLMKKAVFPDMPVKEIFMKRNIFAILAGAVVLGTGDFFAKEYVLHYEFWRNIVVTAGGCLLLLISGLRMYTSKKKARA